MKKKNVKLNYFYNLSYQLVLLLTPLITTPYISRVLGDYGVGQYSFTYSIASIFILLGSLGFGYYAQREIAKKQGDKETQSKIFWEIIIARLIATLVSVALYLLLIYIDVFNNNVYSLLLKILLINVVSTAFDITFLFQGNEEFGIIALRNIIVRIVGITLIFLFVKTSSDIWIYALCQSLILIVGNLSLWTRLPKMIVRVSCKELNIHRHFLPTLRLFIPTIAVSIYTMLDKTLLGILVTGIDENGKSFSDIENGNYEQSEKIVKILLSVLTALGTVMYPKNSQTIASGDFKGFRNNIYKAITFVLFLGLPLMFGISAVAFNFSPWFFGDGYLKVPYLIIILSPIITIIGLSNVLGMQCLLPLEKDKKFTIALIVGAVSNLALNLILIPFLWSYGACIATVCAELFVTIMMFVFSKKDIELKKVLLSNWKYFVASIVMFTCVFATQYFLKSSILNTLVLASEGVTVYFLTLIVLRDSLLKSIVKNVTNRFKKKQSLQGDKNDASKINVLVTGVAGQLGYDVINELSRRGIAAIGTDIRNESELINKAKWKEYYQCDITDKQQVDLLINNVKPDAIIHCAAWTNVDGAEDPNNKPLVKKINVDGTDNLVKAAKKIVCKFIYISTDYVFNGEGIKPWKSDDKDYAPLNYYGQTKLEGELSVSSQLDKFFIVRIAWVFGLNGNNFIKTMLSLADKGYKELKVVDDQIGTPTYTYDLARLLVDMILTDKYGYYHATNEGGYISWADFAEEIFRQANKDVKVNRVTTEEYGISIAKRPFNSRLDKSKLIDNGFKPLPDWKDAVRRYLKEINSD